MAEEIKKEGELSKHQKERDEYLDGWKRAKAELLNYKKDEARRFEAVLKFANESLVKELLTVLDSFDLAIASFEKDSKTQKGLFLIKSQLEDILKRNGLERIKVEIGQPFNPEFHEAIAKIESNQPANIIVEEIEAGYILNGKVIRPARIKIAK
ncbi:nucleotide exchange factor GrpE [Candidatus Wolfebacteria bacterium CG03_land_8_20_14_0_80_36_15]|uniref:Protein GrpE n=1 Tax=Candidatus Wolfebacteria bacterium CG03_land_8_20_14_0_80_36_15 TaxID=1975067 RepID=A0A2M7B830_9BACT|nr:MAG: nucleotide exchange factor GrpE [Candidatus Wolfebacteria bacterium CG03_land_8_20_14_0_80_36_15]